MYKDFVLKRKFWKLFELNLWFFEFSYFRGLLIVKVGSDVGVWNEIVVKIIINPELIGVHFKRLKGDKNYKIKVIVYHSLYLRLNCWVSWGSIIFNIRVSIVETKRIGKRTIDIEYIWFYLKIVGERIEKEYTS